MAANVVVVGGGGLAGRRRRTPLPGIEAPGIWVLLNN